MATAHDLQEQIEQLDLQILGLLGDRAKLYAQFGEETPKEFDGDALAMWIEEASDRGLDEGTIEKIAKLVILLCRRGEEE